MGDAEDLEVVENIVDLPILEEHHIVKNLKARYGSEKIYTNVGNILIAVNPYKLTNIYGLGMVTKYHKVPATSLPPHLFAQGNAAYMQMKEEMENQVVVISGESGSGKTESTKLLMHFLAKISNKSERSCVTEQILEANPILESFGNAKTLINDNSSRFGKYVSLYFSNGAMVGSKTNKYLLERSRIVKQLPGERNYHIFYEMFRGLPNNFKQELHLNNVMGFAYLNFGKDAAIDSRDDLANFQIVQRAFEHHKFAQEDINGIFKTLSAILHLGNAKFKQTENINSMDEVSLESETCCKIVSELLKVPFEGLSRILTTRVTEARNEKMVIPLTKDQAFDVRDSISKALYYRVFSWLVSKINTNSKYDEQLKNLNSIAILDIFGFEDLVFNSFEQLCINYANESLQYYFNKHIFKIEQEEYVKEGVTWYTIDFLDNQPVVDLIAKKPSGIFHLLDEESYFPNGSDRSFLEKCHAKHDQNKFYIKPRMQDPEFSIKHYAGLVTYNVMGFLDKNRDSLKTEVMLFLLESQSPLVSRFFENDFDSKDKRSFLKIDSRNTSSPKSKSGTVSTLFHDSLQSLLEMMRCNPWFIRCIKPNNSKTSMLFEDSLVLSQLRATGMLETVKIRKLGFCVRQKFQAFYQKFKSLLPSGQSRTLKMNEACKSILESQPEVWLNSWEIGKTKVFMKEDFLGHLLRTKSKIVTKAVLVFQKYARGRLARDQLRRNGHAVLSLQAAWRGWIARRQYDKARDATILMQAQIRGMLSQKKYKKMVEEDKNRVDENKRRHVQRFQDEMKARRSKIFEEIKAEGPQPNEVIKGKIVFSLDANTLDVPIELAHQINKHPGFDDEDAFVQIRNVTPMSFMPQLPLDINTFDFKKYAQVYCPESLECVPKGFHEAPILSKTSEHDSKTTLELSKLLLRFLIHENDSSVNQVLSLDFIVSRCISSSFLKDEILLQICSKTFAESNSRILWRAWMLVTLCTGCFHSSQVLFNYLLNYASHYCSGSLAPYCQRNLLRASNVPTEVDRCHPPCRLEWTAACRGLPMALGACSYDGNETYVEVDAWMCAEEFAREMFKQRGLDDSGWALELVDENICCFVSGTDFVLDAIKEVETEAIFLSCNPHLLAYKFGPNRVRSGSNLEKSLSWKPMDLHGVEELKEFVPALPRSAVPANLFFKFSNRRDSLYARADETRPTFGKMLADLGISKKSPLNERFLVARYVESDDQGQLQPVGDPSSSLLDLSQIRPKFLKRTFVDSDESNGPNDPNLSVWVENVFEPALKDEGGLNYINAEEISRMMKGGEEDNEKTKKPDPPVSTRPNPTSIPIKFPPILPRPEIVTKATNKKVNYEEITEDDIEDDREYFDLSKLRSSDTRLLVVSPEFHLSYKNIKWSLRARKEVFTRNESATSNLANELIYLQIISDLDKKCIRIREEDETELKSKMGCRDLDFVTKKNHSAKEKAAILEIAKQWPNYFSRIYQVSGGSRLTTVQYLGISHMAVRLLSRIRKGSREQFDVMESISYEEMIDVSVPQPCCLQIHYKPDKYVALYFKQAPRAQNLIEAFCIELEQNSVYVKAIQNYRTNESTLLSFAKGDIIKLTNKNQVLEQGWLFGAVHGRVGMFPAEFVVPVAIHQVPLKAFEVYSTLPDFSLYNTLKGLTYSCFEEARQDYVMLEYATKNFRRNNSISSFLGKDSKKVHNMWEGQEFLEKVKWTKSPIKDSLTLITSDKLNKLAVHIFKCIMEYMHDYPLTKLSSSHGSVSTIFSYCHDYHDLIDETYCQIIKQLTSNRSPKSDSCQQGWRLLMMFTSFFECGEVLKPHVLKYLEKNARDVSSPDCKLAEKCLHCLKQTMKFGGRKGTLDKTEISSITLGRYTRQVICTVPGNTLSRIFVETSMVVKDAVEQICESFGIGSLECCEYIIYIIHENERSLIPLDDSTYVMDIVTDLTLKEKSCQFLFCRFTWVFPLQTAINPSHLSLMFAQSKPDYLDGFIIKPPTRGTLNHVRETILKLSFFLMKNDHFVAFNNKKGVQKYLPKNVVRQFTGHELQQKFEQLFGEYGDVSQQQSQQYFLETLSKLPLFGSTFFVLNCVVSEEVNGKCLLGVNGVGLNFLSEKSMEVLWTLPLHRILAVELREEKRKFLELKHGDLLVYSVVHLFTENPHPLRLLIERYIKVYSIFRSSSSSTGSSGSSDDRTCADPNYTNTLASNGRAWRS